MDAKGKSGTVELHGDAVTIHRKGSIGWSATTQAVETRVPIDQILAIQLKAATLLGNGAIRFIVAGAHDWKRLPDEGTVTFTFRQNATFEALAAAIAKAIGERPRLIAC